MFEKVSADLAKAIREYLHPSKVHESLLFVLTISMTKLLRILLLKSIWSNILFHCMALQHPGF